MKTSEKQVSIRSSFLLFIGAGMLFISVVMTILIGNYVFKMSSAQSGEVITALTEKKAQAVESEMMENISSAETLAGLLRCWFFVGGCAGGGRLGVALPIHRKEQEGNSYTITVDGLQGGHSGNEIHKGRANADMLMARMLRRLSQEKELALLSFAGGEKDNAIPRKAVASVLSDGRAAEVAALVADEEAKIRAIYGTADPDIAIRVTSEQDASLRNAVTAEDTKMIIRLMLSLPNGVVRMSDHIEGLVETSLNLGILQLKEDTLTMTYALRSSVAAAYEALRENMRFMAEGYGAEVEIHSEYPAWEYVADSPLREKMIDIYREQTGKTLVVEAIHAGLECGIFAGKLKGLDAVSFGPDIFDIHTPKERLSISSVERTYRFLRAILEQK